MNRFDTLHQSQLRLRNKGNWKGLQPECQDDFTTSVILNESWHISF